ncbi:hypothetical protein D3C81_1059060 [compost metagenome]
MLQRRQQAQHGALVQAGAARQLGQRQALVGGSEGAEEGEGAVQHGDTAGGIGGAGGMGGLLVFHDAERPEFCLVEHKSHIFSKL